MALEAYCTDIGETLRHRVRTAARNWVLPYNTAFCETTLAHYVAANFLRRDLVGVAINQVTTRVLVEAVPEARFEVLHATPQTPTDPRPRNPVRVFVPSAEAEAIQASWAAATDGAVRFALGVLRRAVTAFVQRLTVNALPSERGVLGGLHTSFTRRNLARHGTEHAEPVAGPAPAPGSPVLEGDSDAEDDDADDDADTVPFVPDDEVEEEDIAHLLSDGFADIHGATAPGADTSDNDRMVPAPLYASALAILLGRWAPLSGFPTERLWALDYTSDDAARLGNTRSSRAVAVLYLVLQFMEEAGRKMLSTVDGVEDAGLAAARLFAAVAAGSYRDTATPGALLRHRDDPDLRILLGQVLHVDTDAIRMFVVRSNALAPPLSFGALRAADAGLEFPLHTDASGVVNVEHLVENLLRRVGSGVWDAEERPLARGALSLLPASRLLRFPAEVGQALTETALQVRTCWLMALHMVYNNSEAPLADGYHGVPPLPLPQMKALCKACGASDTVDVHEQRARELILAAMDLTIDLPARLRLYVKSHAKPSSFGRAVLTAAAGHRVRLIRNDRSTRCARGRLLATASRSAPFLPRPVTWTPAGVQGAPASEPWDWAEAAGVAVGAVGSHCASGSPAFEPPYGPFSRPGVGRVLLPFLGAVTEESHRSERARTWRRMYPSPVAAMQATILRGQLAPVVDSGMLLLGWAAASNGPPVTHLQPHVCLRLLPTLAILWHVGRVLRREASEASDAGGSDRGESGGAPCLLCGSPVAPVEEAADSGVLLGAAGRPCSSHPLCMTCMATSAEVAVRDYLQTPFLNVGTPAAAVAARQLFEKGFRCLGPGCGHGALFHARTDPAAWDPWLPQELAFVAAAAAAAATTSMVTPRVAGAPSASEGCSCNCSFCGATVRDPRNTEWGSWRPEQDGPVWWCPVCGGHTCNQCGRHAHTGVACVAGPRGGAVRPEDLLANAKIQRCPGCRTPSVKRRDCNHMTCTLCSTHWCWMCAQAIDSRDPSVHFVITSPMCAEYTLHTEVARMQRALRASGAPVSVIDQALDLLSNVFAQNAEDL